MLPLVTLHPPPPVYGGQQVRILGENYTLEDEEDSKIGQVSWYCMLLGGLLAVPNRAVSARRMFTKASIWRVYAMKAASIWRVYNDCDIL